MGTRRRIRRLQTWLVAAAAIGAPLAFATAASAADGNALAVQALARAQPAPAFLGAPAWNEAALLAPALDAPFARPTRASAPDADAVAAGVRADMDRLASSTDAEILPETGGDRVDGRVALVFASVRTAEDGAVVNVDSAARDRSDVASAARRWIPAVSPALIAFALPTR
jgi:hypothetical protein